MNVMKYGWHTLLSSMLLCVFLFVTGCENSTMAEKEEHIRDLFLEDEIKGAEKLISWIQSDSVTFDYDFPCLQQEGIIHLVNSGDKNIRQYDICYTLDDRKLYGKNVVQYRSEKGQIRSFVGSLKSLSLVGKNSEFSFDCDGMGIITVPRWKSPLYLFVAVECEHLPYSYFTVTPLELRGENLVYVENVFPDDVNFEFDASSLDLKDIENIFSYSRIDDILYIQEKNEYNQLIDSFACYQWNGEQFINP